eukprot:SAG22_NODE_10177_length_549_cov_0.928889_1_plen_173_part_10
MHNRFRKKGTKTRCEKNGEVRWTFELDGRVYVTDQFQHFGIDLFDAAVPSLAGTRGLAGDLFEANVWRVVVSTEKRMERGERNLQRLREKQAKANSPVNSGDDLRAFKVLTEISDDGQWSTPSGSTVSKPVSSVSDPIMQQTDLALTKAKAGAQGKRANTPNKPKKKQLVHHP